MNLSVASFTTDLRPGQIRQRLVAIFVATTLVLLALFVRVAWLQTFGRAGYLEASVEQRVRESTVRAERGSILDRRGFELALPVPTRTIFADPRKITDPVGTARALATILRLTPEDEAALVARLSRSGSSFAYVLRQTTPEVADAVLALGLAGIGWYTEQGRSVTSQSVRTVVGRTDPDLVGVSGLEKQYHEVLAGIDGRSVREVNAEGRSIATGAEVEELAVRGANVVTTIDRNLQFRVDGILTQQVERLGALGGVALVLDVRTGDVLAMSSVRRRADGTYGSEAGNLAVVEAYEPGSVAKVFSLSAALNERTVSVDSTFLVPGAQTFDKGTPWEFTISDAYPHDLESMSVRRIFVDSSNLGTVQIAETISPRQRYDYLRAFGFGERTALDFPGESRGLLATPDRWRGTEKVTSSYGYGYATTPLQLAAAVNVVANDGVYVHPRLVSAVVGADGVTRETPLVEGRRVIGAQTAATMRELMRGVVCEGTAKLAKVPGMSVAGKTGTGYKRQDNGTYVKDDGSRAYFASFVGFLPALSPQYTVLVSIDEPDPASRDRFGGTAAAPVFSNIAQALIAEMGLRPGSADPKCAAGGGAGQ